MKNESDKRADAKYKKEKTIQIQLRLYVNTEQDIIQHLNSVKEPKATYIKRLIREDIKRG